MSVYGFCTSGTRNGAFVPVIFRIEKFRPQMGHHKNPIFQRDLWWARQGLNLRPHPCEGELQFRLSTLFLNDKTEQKNCPCTRFVRRPLAYWLAVPANVSLKSYVAQSTRQVLAKYGSSDGGRWPPPRQRKTAGRAATLRSGSSNSCGAMAKSYRRGDSRARAVLAGEVL